MLLYLGLVLLGILAYYKWCFQYWKKRNLVCFENPTIPFGNIGQVSFKNVVFAEFLKNVYNIMKRKGYKHAGSYIIVKPVYIVNDPDIIKTILQRNFDDFSERLYHVDETGHPLEANIVFVGGKRWKYLRSKLSPAFTPVKLKAMLNTIVDCAHIMQKSLNCLDKQAVDVKEVALCYVIDIIGACGFGLDCNSFENPKSEFIKHGRMLLDMKSIKKSILAILKITCPNLTRRLGMKIFDIKSYNIFVELIKDTVKFRKHNNVERKDLLQLLLDSEPDLNVEEIDNESSKSAEIIHELTGHGLALFLAGFETSSATVTFCLFELAKDKLIQDKLRKEIDSILKKNEEKITYEAIKDMSYLNQVVEETLRKYPPIPHISRRCVNDFKIPDTDVIIEKETMVVMSILGIHYDAEYYPDPENFDPERFSEENKAKRMPYTYLPFGEGPRICPASRFGLMQIKVGLIVLLQKYELSLNKRTELSIKYDSRNILLVPKTQIFLTLRNISKS